MFGVRSERIHALADQLGLSKTELLALAREIAQDATLRSVEHMYQWHMERLETGLILMDVEVLQAA
jgi:hypothetical protein